MTQPNTNSSSFNQSLHSDARERCRHYTATGRRCRIPAEAISGLCCRHRRDQVAEIASTLTANLTDFTSAIEINDFLSRLLLLLAQDKISTRRAAVLTYIASQLLRTLPAINKEEDREPQIILDMQRPERSEQDQDTPPSALDVEKVPA